MDPAPSSAGSSEAGREQPPTTAAPCQLDALWDAWIRCTVHSKCFQQAEASLGGKGALKHCARPDNMPEDCKTCHQAWSDCARLPPCPTPSPPWAPGSVRGELTRRWAQAS